MGRGRPVARHGGARRRSQRQRRADMSRVAVAAARLDDGELDRAWAAALRGDADTLAATLARAMPTRTTASEDERTHSHERASSPWRDSSWLFGRRAFKRTQASGDDDE